MLVGTETGVGLTRSTITSFAPFEISHHGSKKTVLMVVSSLWQILLTRPATSHKPSKSAVSGMRIATKVTSRPFNLITIACGEKSTNFFKVK